MNPSLGDKHHHGQDGGNCNPRALPFLSLGFPAQTFENGLPLHRDLEPSLRRLVPNLNMPPLPDWFVVVDVAGIFMVINESDAVELSGSIHESGIEEVDVERFKLTVAKGTPVAAPKDRWVQLFIEETDSLQTGAGLRIHLIFTHLVVPSTTTGGPELMVSLPLGSGIPGHLAALPDDFDSAVFRHAVIHSMKME